MGQSQYLEKIHKEILLVMDEVDRICTEYGLRYYLIGGTLLGAVRHDGFIPWDDDLDIVMPRDDFERFIDICKDGFQPNFRLSWITTNCQYRHLYAKIENINTIFYESVEYKSGFPGVFVDVFPLDETNGYSPALDERKKVLRKISTMMGMKVTQGKNKKIKRCLVKLIPTRLLNRIAVKLMTKDNGKETEYFTNFGSQYSAKKQTIPKDCYGQGVRIPFEGRFYTAPVDYTAVLTSIFGADYMQLPPEEKRRSHYPRYVKFSDGTELHFEEPTQKVKGDFD